jgi:hypothetical protein
MRPAGTPPPSWSGTRGIPNDRIRSWRPEGGYSGTVTSDLQRPDAGHRTAAEPDWLPEPAPAPHDPGRSDRPGAYWTGLVVLAVGLVVTVLALATRVTSIVQTVLLAIPLCLLGLGIERVGRGVGRGSLRVVGASILLLAVVGPIVLSLSSPSGGVIARRNAPVPSGASSAVLRASLSGGQLRVGPGATGLYQAELRGPGTPAAEVSDGRVAVVDLRAPTQHGLLARNRGNDWVVQLSSGLPWRAEVNAGALTADLDLQRLNVRGVRVESGVSRLAVRLGQPAAEVPVSLQVSTGLIDLYLPRGSAAEVRVDGLAVNDFGQQGLTRSGGAWRTPNAGQADRFTIDIGISGGRLRLHRT